MTQHTPLLRFAAVGLAVLGLAACDVTDPLEDVDLLIDITDAPVDIPASVGTLTVVAGEPTLTSGTVSNTTDIDRVDELKAIRILPEYLTFTPAAVAAGAGADLAAQTGSLSLFVFIDGVPVPGTPVQVTIVDDAVTAVSPQSITISGATIDAGTIEAFIESLGAFPPALTDGWETLTVDQVVARINTALVASSIPISIGVTATGDLDGTIRLSQISFDAEVALSTD